MARRPVFTPLGTRPHVREVSTEFTLHPGLSLKQEQRSVDSLHRSFLSAHPGARMLEVSGGSPLVLGAELSAFRLETRTFFYDWLYVSALAGHPELVNELEHRAAFTDIEFNPKRSINCQAHSVALFQGIAGGRRRDSLRPPDHPRSRGVYAGRVDNPLRALGSSPLARGLPEPRRPPHSLRRIIPARAGFTNPTFLGRNFTTDHPRSRGVYLKGLTMPDIFAGSSPLARGLPPSWDGATVRAGIIPARAGFTGDGESTCAWLPDHPRSRGVYSGPRRSSLPGLGSSPLARGLRASRRPQPGPRRIIPARAGFTRVDNPLRAPLRDHPRSRGVYFIVRFLPVVVSGSSPLARGLPADEQFHEADGRIIPARAGFTSASD